MRAPQTLAQSVDYSGIGIHTGAIVSLRFLPAPPGTGWVFRRTDLPGEPEIPARVEYVCDTARSTTIGVGDVKVHTVEHVLAALKAYQIDNCFIEVSAEEPPVGDGSSAPFVEMIEEAGIETQPGTVPCLVLKEPVWLSQGEIQIVALPAPEYRISYTLSYSEPALLKAQFQSFVITPETFKKELAPCRTFSRYEEVAHLMERGLIKGGSLDNAVIIKGEAVLSKGGLHYPDEMVRHKILDFIGDFGLVGFDVQAHIISIRSGHETNVAFTKKLEKLHVAKS